MTDKIILAGSSSFPNFGNIDFVIHIIDGKTLAEYSNQNFMKALFKEEKKLGNKVTLNERSQCIIEEYPGKTKEEIAKQLESNFKEHNIKFKEKS